MEEIYQRYLKKKDMLEKLMQDDCVYMVWYRAFQRSQDDYAKLRRFLPRKARDTLYRYAECGRMMAERAVCIACLCMEFSEDIPKDMEPIFMREAYEKEGRI